jgi:hypothetical protein
MAMSNYFVPGRIFRLSGYKAVFKLRISHRKNKKFLIILKEIGNSLRIYK